MRLLLVLIVVCSAVMGIEGTICYLARARVTDSQVAAWEAMLMPIRYVADHIDRSMVIASAGGWGNDFPIDSLESFKHVKDPKSFKSTMEALSNEMSNYFSRRSDAQRNVTSAIIDFFHSRNEFLSFLRTMPEPSEAKKFSDIPRRSIESDLAEMETIIGLFLKHDASLISPVLAELANLQPSVKISGQENITSHRYIFKESLKHLKSAVALITKGKTTLFFYDMSLRVAGVKRRLEKFLQYADKVMDTGVHGQLGVKRMLECMTFRILQELEYLRVISSSQHNFFQNYGTLSSAAQALNTEKQNYKTALEAIEKKTDEAREKIKEYVKEAVNKYNAWLDEDAKG